MIAIRKILTNFILYSLASLILLLASNISFGNILLTPPAITEPEITPYLGNSVPFTSAFKKLEPELLHAISNNEPISLGVSLSVSTHITRECGSEDFDSLICLAAHSNTPEIVSASALVLSNLHINRKQTEMLQQALRTAYIASVRKKSEMDSIKRRRWAQARKKIILALQLIGDPLGARGALDELWTYESTNTAWSSNDEKYILGDFIALHSGGYILRVASGKVTYLHHDGTPLIMKGEEAIMEILPLQGIRLRLFVSAQPEHENGVIVIQGPTELNNFTKMIQHFPESTREITEWAKKDGVIFTDDLTRDRIDLHNRQRQSVNENQSSVLVANDRENMLAYQLIVAIAVLGYTVNHHQKIILWDELKTAFKISYQLSLESGPLSECLAMVKKLISNNESLSKVRFRLLTSKYTSSAL